MKIIKSIPQLKKILHVRRLKGNTIGFVPTMGALHNGHLSLIRRSKKENDVTVLSIFVNPAQFGPNEDYKSYPRTLPQDAHLAKKGGVDIIFCPSARAIYPQGYATFIDVATKLTNVLCGKSRPGHFRGVATVVAKLLNIVSPDVLYLGQKDAQQCVVIRRMTSDLNIPTKIVVCPTVRERDGLAMSSRNKYLSPQQRREATVLYQTLRLARSKIQRGERRTRQVIRLMRQHIQTHSRGAIDYIAVVDPETLGSIRTIRAPVLVAVAARFARARLIDCVWTPCPRRRSRSSRS